ncbi:MAG: GIY-YIG nuclease family protein [Verrucomicrobiales bacterium]|nr:GIY-YIG nuclease family protein [Verrucomicrobiales bacterium]
MRSPDAGYIYILQNESLEPDRLKIGRTHHHPEFRAEELSQATGIPTPFTVAWYGRTEDCIKAERLIHRSLSAYRTNPKREFFDVDLDEAIDAGEEAVKISGRRLNWFYRPREQWNIDPDYPPTFGGFLLYKLFLPILRAPFKLVLLCLCTIWWIFSGTVRLLWSIPNALFRALSRKR